MFIYFQHLNDELDKHKENIFWQRKFKYLNIILVTNSSYFLLTILLKNYRKKSKLLYSNTISQQAWSTITKIA